MMIKRLVISFIVAIMISLILIVPCYMFFKQIVSIIERAAPTTDPGSLASEAIELIWRGFRIMVLLIIVLCILLVIELNMIKW